MSNASVNEADKSPQQLRQNLMRKRNVFYSSYGLRLRNEDKK